MKRLFIILLFLVLFISTAWAIDETEFQSPIDQDYYEQIWGVNNICGPTTAAEMIDYWGHHGYPILGTDEEGTLWDMINTYISRTSSGVTYPASWVSGVQRYFTEYGVDAEIILSPKGGGTWTAFKAELDAGRPVAVASYLLNHWVLVIDYNDTGNYYTNTVTVLYGHLPLIRTLKVTQLGPSTMYSVFVRPSRIITEIDPSTESWYNEVMEWCNENNYELEPAD